MNEYPDWLLSLVAAVITYEDQHESFSSDHITWRCLSGPLTMVPTNIVDMARGFERGKAIGKNDR